MKTIGIIAEYNPFHNGHAYQIAELKRKTNADFVVIAMSGDFVQRGAPAIIDKYCRAEMALLCGADLSSNSRLSGQSPPRRILPWQVLPCLIK